MDPTRAGDHDPVNPTTFATSSSVPSIPTQASADSKLSSSPSSLFNPQHSVANQDGPSRLEHSPSNSALNVLDNSTANPASAPSSIPQLSSPTIHSHLVTDPPLESSPPFLPSATNLVSGPSQRSIPARLMASRPPSGINHPLLATGTSPYSLETDGPQPDLLQNDHGSTGDSIETTSTASSLSPAYLSNPLPFLKPNTAPHFSSPLAQTSPVHSDHSKCEDVDPPSIVTLSTSHISSSSMDEGRHSTAGFGPRLQTSVPMDNDPRTFLYKNDPDLPPSSLDYKFDASTNLSRSGSSTWGRNLDEGDLDHSSRAHRLSQSPSSQSIARKTSLNKSGVVPAINRKDVVRIGSPLRHVTQLGSGLSPAESQDSKSQSASKSSEDPPHLLNPQSSLADDLLGPQTALSTSSALGLSGSRSTTDLPSPLISPTNQSVLFGSPTPRRKSTLNPMASLNQYQFFSSSSSPSMSSLSISTSSASTSSSSHDHSQIENSGPTSTAPTTKKSSNATARRTSDPTQVLRTPSLKLQSKTHSKPIHQQSSPSLIAGTTSHPSSSRNSSPASTKSVPSHTPSHSVSTSYGHQQLVQHSRQMSLTSPPGSGQVTTHRRNSLIFTPGNSSTKSNHHYNKSALSAALANNSSSAPPFPPIEAIKLKRVPTSVRVAQDLRPSNPTYSHPSSNSLTSAPQLKTPTGLMSVATHPVGSRPSLAHSSEDNVAHPSLTRDSISASSSYPTSPPNMSLFPRQIPGGTLFGQRGLSGSPFDSASSSFNSLYPAHPMATTQFADSSSGEPEGGVPSSWSSGSIPVLGGGSTQSKNVEAPLASLASPITFTSIGGYGEGSSNSGSHGSRGQPGSHFPPLSYSSSPSSPYAIQRGLIQTKFADRDQLRDRSTSIFSMLSEDPPYSTVSPAPGASATAVARPMGVIGHHGAQTDEFSLSPFSLTDASTTSSGRISRPLVRTSGGCHTNPSSGSFGTPVESASTCSSSSLDVHQIGLPPPVHLPKPRSDQRATMTSEAPRSRQPLSRQLSSSLSSRRTALRNHRTSIAPGTGPSTEDFAKIIIQSRSAKIQKWKQQQQVHSQGLNDPTDPVSDTQPRESTSGGIPPSRSEASVRTEPRFSTIGSSLGIVEANRYKTQLSSAASLETNTITGRTLVRNKSDQYGLSERFLRPNDGILPERKRIPSFSATPSTRFNVEGELSRSRIDEEDERRSLGVLPSTRDRNVSLDGSASDHDMLLSQRRTSSVRTIGAGQDPGLEGSEFGQGETDDFDSPELMRKSASNMTVPSSHNDFHLSNNNSSGPTALREIEWVDWLDDYRRMKEAKLREESREKEEDLAEQGIKLQGDPHNQEDSSSNFGSGGPHHHHHHHHHPPPPPPPPVIDQSPLTDESQPGSSATSRKDTQVSPRPETVAAGGDIPTQLHVSSDWRPGKSPTDAHFIVPPSPSLHRDENVGDNQIRKSNLSLLITKGLKTSGSSSRGSRRSVSRPRLTKQFTSSQADLSHAPSPVLGSSSSDLAKPSGKNKKNFTLGKKIDDWWSAVRTSFTANADVRTNSTFSDTGSSYQTNAASLKPRSENQLSTSPVISEAPQGDDYPSQSNHEIRLASSLTHLKSTNDSDRQAFGSQLSTSASPLPVRPIEHFQRSVPTGALAPIPKPLDHSRSMEGSRVGSPAVSQDGSHRFSNEQRRRNPHLTLKLNRLSASEMSGVVGQFNQQQSRQSSSQSLQSCSSQHDDVGKSTIKGQLPLPTSLKEVSAANIKSPPLPLPPPHDQSTSSKFLVDITQPEPTPVLSPTGNRMWDRTPGLVLGNPFTSHSPSVIGDLIETRNSSQLHSSEQPPATTGSTELNPRTAVGSTSGLSIRQVSGKSEVNLLTSHRMGSQQSGGKLGNTGSATVQEPKYQPSFSMHTIRQHIKNRLSTAKTLCDNSLKAIIFEITTYVEKEAQNLREQDRIQQELALVSDAIQGIPSSSWCALNDAHSDHSHTLNLEGVHPELNNTDLINLPVDRSFRTTTPSCSPRHSLNRTLSIPTDFSVSPASSPLHLQRSISVYPLDFSTSEPSSLPASTTLSRRGSRQGRVAQSSGSISSSVLPTARGLRRASITHRRGGVGSSGTSHVIRGLESPIRGGSRSVSISTQPSGSVESSRSTSRSRSPLPRPLGQAPSSSHRRSSPRADSIALNLAASSVLTSATASDEKFYNSPFVAALQDISSIATEILDTPVGVLASKSLACVEVIHRVQQIGKSWDEHDDWPHRGWYVRVLLAVAGLSRVLEWWDAEKGFWNFAPEDEDDGEEICFFATRVEQHPHNVDSSQVSVRPSSSIDVIGTPYASVDGDQFRLGTPQVNSDHTSTNKLVDSFALPPPISDVTASISDQQLGSSNHEGNHFNRGIGFTRSSHEAAHSAKAGSMSSLSEVRYPQSAGLTKPPARAPEDLDQDFTRSIELARTETILAEVSLENSVILYLSPGWTKVTGLDPQSVTGTPLGELIDGNYEIFNEANRRLMEDVGNTVELQFTIKICLATSDQEEDSNHSIKTKDHFLPMTAKGMLMVDRITGEGLHSMWVIRLNPRQAQAAQSETTMGHRGSHHTRSHSDPITPFPAPTPLSTEPLLCRICEHYLPAYYFERHNETCAETHRLEMQVSECNERLSDLKDTIREMRSTLERNGSVNDLSYGNLPLQSFNALPSSALSPLNPGRASISSSPQHGSFRSNVKLILDEIGDLLNTALDISTPSSNEEVEQSIENLRLLSPNSERKLMSVSKWELGPYEDPALTNLAADVERAANEKCSAVNRMRNTILYAERIRMEWEAKAQQTFMTLPKRSANEGPSTPSPTLGDEIGRPRSAPYKGDMNPSKGDPKLRRRSSPPFILPATKSAIASRLAPIDTKGIGSKGLGITNSQPYSGVGTPPRSPRLPGLQQSHSRRSSQARQNGSLAATPLSPRIPSAIPGKSKSAASIKDFDMLKPISKGAFGQVWLAKKKTTGDYYAIKILKKQDMIAKNQIMNVKSERKILMNQADSDFVVKLFYTFSSRDHLYLVMEYLNGGDCAALVKALGNLPEEWTRNYVAEVVMGLEYLHSTGVVHRDLKPDNLLIDHRGHLKLTDFGLSKIGLLGRQAAEPRGPMSLSSSSRDPTGDKRKLSGLSNSVVPSSGSESVQARSSAASTPDLSTIANSSYFLSRPVVKSYITNSTQSQTLSTATHEIENLGTPSSESSSKDSEQIHQIHQYRRFQKSIPIQSSLSVLPHSTGSSSLSGPGHNQNNKASDAGHKHFVGTPDYLAPESILGIGMDEMVDWWALGVICYEFLYGIPPFHDATPDKVFDNILSRRLEWPESDDDISPEAIDFMNRLMCTDPKQRLGAQGAIEVKGHPFLAGIDWAHLFKSEASFVPSVTDPESTDYFDPRGATQVFHDDEEVPSHAVTTTAVISPSGFQSRGLFTLPSPLDLKDSTVRTASARSTRPPDDFGTFNFKNLPVLERANEEVIRRLKVGQAGERVKYPRHMSLSGKVAGLVSPTESTSSSAPSSSKPLMPQLSPHSRRPSEQYRTVPPGTLDDPSRRNSMPSKMRRASFSGIQVTPPLPPLPEPSSEKLETRGRAGSLLIGGPLGSSSSGPPVIPNRLVDQNQCPGSTASSPGRTFKPLLHHLQPLPISSPPPKSLPPLQERVVYCLIAEDNPISSKVLETILIRFGCKCVVVPNGEDAISIAMGDIAFDVIFMDLMMPLIEGQDAARMIKSTQNPNASTPIVAVTSFESYVSEQGTLFSALLTKPVNKKDVLNVMKRLGFVARQTNKTQNQLSATTATNTHHHHHPNSNSNPNHDTLAPSSGSLGPGNPSNDLFVIQNVSSTVPS